MGDSENVQLDVSIGVPTRGNVRAEWAVQLAQMAYPVNTTRQINLVPGRTVEEARNACVKAALKYDARYLFFLDDDVLIPNDTLLRMVQKLEREPKWSLVSAIVPTKTEPAEPCVFRGHRPGGYWGWKPGETFEIDACGMACCLIRTEVFKEMDEPWFNWTKSSENGNYVEQGEDVGFCKRLSKAGGRLLADAGVICAHIDNDDGTIYSLELN